MRRREFIGLIGTIGAVWPRNLVAQPADQLKKKMPRIGFLASVPHERIDAFDRGLREQGYFRRREHHHRAPVLEERSGTTGKVCRRIGRSGRRGDRSAHHARGPCRQSAYQHNPYCDCHRRRGRCRAGGKFRAARRKRHWTYRRRRKQQESSGFWRNCCREHRGSRSCSTPTTNTIHSRWPAFRKPPQNDAWRFCRW